MCVKQRHVSPVKAVVLSGAEGGSEAWKHSWHPADLYWTSSRSDTTSNRTQQSLSTLTGPLNRWHATTWTWRPWRGCCHRNLSGNSTLLPRCCCFRSLVCSVDWHLIQGWNASLVVNRKMWTFCLFRSCCFSIFESKRMGGGEKEESSQKAQDEVEIKVVEVCHRANVICPFQRNKSWHQICGTSLGIQLLYFYMIISDLRLSTS